MKKKYLLISIASAVVLSVAGTSLGLYFGLRSQSSRLSANVEVYETSGTKAKLQARQDDLTWAPYEFSGNTEVNINPRETKGNLHGVGVAMTHSSAYLFQTMDEAQKDYALASLFATDQGHLNVVRIPIGTSDYTYTSSFYTHDDMPSGQKDYELEHFSISHDEEYLIPTLLEIKELNPNIIFVAAPWSAPAWMKSNESLVGGNLIGHSETSLTLEEEAYAAYLIKFVSEYQSKGINIAYLSLINEPTIANVDYPSMQMGTTQYIRVATEVAKNIAQANLKTKIMAYDHNVGSESDRIMFDLFAEEIDASSALRSAVSGFAFHAYGAQWSSIYPNLFADNQDNYPKMENYMTEITESDESVDFAANLSWSTANVTVGPLSHGASMSIYWNALLTSEGLPVLGNDAHCFGMLSENNGVITKAAAYYSFTHISRFAYAINGKEPVLVDSLSDNEAKIKSVAYRRGDGAYVFVLANNDSTTYEDVDVVMNGQVVTYRVQPESIVTLVANTEDNHVSYSEGLQFREIEIVQQTINAYELNIELDKDYTDISFHVGVSDIFAESDLVDYLEETNGIYSVSLQTDVHDLCLWAISGDKYAFIPLSLPIMNPSVTLEGNVATVTFGLDQTTSWSSFCDPYGKAIYRSAKAYFDQTAEQVNIVGASTIDPIYILEESYQDAHYNPEKPYYYLVMTGKNGLSRFVSYPLIDGSGLFGAPSLTLSNITGTPILDVVATITGNTSPDDLILRISEINGETFEVSNLSETSLHYQFDCSRLTKSGVWYDILIVEQNTAISYELPISAVSKNNITINERRYAFEEWSGIAKIAFNALNYGNASADLMLLSETPLLVVEGTMGIASSANLLITYWTGSESAVLITATNINATQGRFSFQVNLSELTVAGTYYDIVLVVDDIRSDMTSDMTLNFARSITHAGRTYTFQRWQGLLKVTFN